MVNTDGNYDGKNEQWSMPINVLVSKLVKFGDKPVSLFAGARYWAEAPEGGPEGVGSGPASHFCFPNRRTRTHAGHHAPKGSPMTNTVKAALAVALLVFSQGAAQAADVSPLVAPQPAPEEQGKDWSFSASPYFWGASLSGKTSQFGLPTIKIDSSFSDIWDNLDFAFMAAAEFRYERISIIGDVMYTKLSADADTPFGLLTREVDVQSEAFAGLLGAGYAVIDGPQGHLDVVGGIRVWSVDTTITLNGGLLDGRERSDGATWVDGLVGLRGRYHITPEWFVSGWGLVGTGGADIDWDVAASIGYQFNDTISAVAGYRALGVDYRSDGFVFDTVQQGPILGMTLKF